METYPEILELIAGKFRRVEWSDFVQLTPREIARQPFVLKAHRLYFVGDGWDTNVGRIVAQRHPGKVRHTIEWLEVTLPYWTSDMMDKPLISLPMRTINDGNASEVLERIQRLVQVRPEVVA